MVHGDWYHLHSTNTGAWCTQCSAVPGGSLTHLPPSSARYTVPATTLVNTAFSASMSKSSVVGRMVPHALTLPSPLYTAMDRKASSAIAMVMLRSVASWWKLSGQVMLAPV